MHELYTTPFLETSFKCQYIISMSSPLFYIQSWSASSYSINARKHFRFALQDVTERSSVDVLGRASPWRWPFFCFPPLFLPLAWLLLDRDAGVGILVDLFCDTTDSETEERLVRPPPPNPLRICFSFTGSHLVEGVDKLLVDSDVLLLLVELATLPQWRRYSGSLK